MAFYDNKHWLLSHLRNSFICSDDTGMCECVIIDNLSKDSELFGENDKYPNVDESSDEDDNYDNSLDFQGNVNRTRLGTNTEQRLAKMDKRMKQAAAVTHVQWETPIKVSDDLFVKKEIKPLAGPLKSLFSAQIADGPVFRKNPFIEYAQFGGDGYPRKATRTFRIYLTMLEEPERNYPLIACVVLLARFHELVGYVCWKYTTEHADSDFRLIDDVTRYGVYHVENTGEVDWDLPPIDPREGVDRYEVKEWALVELPEKSKTDQDSGEAPDDVAAAAEKSAESAADEMSWKKLKGDLTAIEALLYQSFAVQIVTKIRTKSDVILGINGDKMDIHPVVTSVKVPGKMWRLKSATYEMDNIVFCELIETKSSGRVAFRVVRRTPPVDGTGTFPPRNTSPWAAVYTGTSTYKAQDFEAEHKMAEEIELKGWHVNPESVEATAGRLQRAADVGYVCVLLWRALAAH